MKRPSLFRSPRSSGTELYGRRLVLRPLTEADYPAVRASRERNIEWLTPWEPLADGVNPNPLITRPDFMARIAARRRERSNDRAYAFGIFIGGHFAGECNINSVNRGAAQSGAIGYWIDHAYAGHSYMSEAVAVLLRFAFDHANLHRVEICIVPRNHNSHRVVDKLGIRSEGVAQGFLQINGVWEDHVRYAITAEEWSARRDDIMRRWLTPTQR